VICHVLEVPTGVYIVQFLFTVRCGALIAVALTKRNRDPEMGQRPVQPSFLQKQSCTFQKRAVSGDLVNRSCESGY
jgi:hypothetical protein